MDKEQTLKQLVAASKVIEALIATLRLELSEAPSDDSKTCPGCGRSYPQSAKFDRGRCRACYQLMRSSVKDGTTTWEKLEKDGACDPPRQAGRKPARTVEEIAQTVKESKSTYRKNQKN